MTVVTWHQARVLMLAPWQWRRNDGSLWALRLYAVLSVLLLVLPAGAALWWMPLRAAAAVVGVLAFLAVVLCWAVQLGAWLRLDHPHVAHAVPGHSGALRVATVGLWLGLVALCGLTAAVGGWLLDGGAYLGLAVALGAATTLFLLALAVRWWWLWLPLSLGPAFMGEPTWRGWVVGTGLGLQRLWQAQPWTVTLAVLLLQALLLPLVFGRGDGRHARAYAARERMRRIAADGTAGHKPMLAAYGRWGEWLGQPWQRLADAWLAQVCRRAQPTPRSAMARAEVVLHGPQHWVRFLSTGLLVQVTVALCLWVTVRMTGTQLPVLLEGGHVGISIGLTSMALSAVMTLPAALWHTRREQALLALLPGVPQGAALSRALAWRQLRQCLWTWVVMLPALCLVAGGLSAFALSRWPGAWLPWLLAVLALTAGLLAWRWRRMAELPQALPAGRLG